MAKQKEQPDNSTLRFSEEKIRMSRQYKEHNSGPLWGELNILLYGDNEPPPNEEWRLIRSSEAEQYWVSNFGNFALWRERNARIWLRGYLQAIVYVNGEKKPRALHVLVAKAFCNWQVGETLVRHLNSNRLENHANNLCPGTYLDNRRDSNNKMLGKVPVVHPPKKELWRLSPEFAGVRISNQGNVKIGWWVAFNCKGYYNKTGPRKGTKKHINLKIVLNKKHRYELLHRLVYEAFHGGVPEGMFVLHFNDDCHNNRLENLVLGTADDNAKSRIANGHQLFGMSHPNAKYADEQREAVIFFLLLGVSPVVASSLTEVGIQTVYAMRRRMRLQSC